MNATRFHEKVEWKRDEYKADLTSAASYELESRNAIWRKIMVGGVAGTAALSVAAVSRPQLLIGIPCSIVAAICGAYKDYFDAEPWRKHGSAWKVVREYARDGYQGRISRGEFAELKRRALVDHADAIPTEVYAYAKYKTCFRWADQPVGFAIPMGLDKFTDMWKNDRGKCEQTTARLQKCAIERTNAKISQDFPQ